MLFQMSADAASWLMTVMLASMLLSVELLQEGAAGELTKAQKEIVDAQKQDVERLDHLMRELLDISRLEAGSAPPRRPGRRLLRLRCSALALIY